MLYNRKGLLHKIMLWLVLIVGFAVAIGWPQLRKAQELARAKEALAGGRNIAAAEMVYFKANGAYAGDFRLMDKPLTCPLEQVDGVFVLKCKNYSYRVEGDLLKISHNQYKKWFTISLVDGKADCLHEPESLAGAHLCANVKMD